MSDLIDSLDPCVVLIYYAGHGKEIGAESYLLPINIEAPEALNDIYLTILKCSRNK